MKVVISSSLSLFSFLYIISYSYLNFTMKKLTCYILCTIFIEYKKASKILVVEVYSSTFRFLQTWIQELLRVSGHFLSFQAHIINKKKNIIEKCPSSCQLVCLRVHYAIEYYFISPCRIYLLYGLTSSSN